MEIILFCFATGIWTLSFSLTFISQKSFYFPELYYPGEVAQTRFARGENTFSPLNRRGMDRGFRPGVAEVGQGVTLVGSENLTGNIRKSSENVVKRCVSASFAFSEKVAG